MGAVLSGSMPGGCPQTRVRRWASGGLAAARDGAGAAGAGRRVGGGLGTGAVTGCGGVTPTKSTTIGLPADAPCGGVTTIGNDNWMLAYTHIAHDCIVGNHCIFSNNTTLAGHVTVGNWVIISGFAGAHQFCRIGDHAFLGMGALVNGDVPPFTMVGSDSLGRPRGINSEGLKRRGFAPDRISTIKRAYRTLYVAGLPLAEAKSQLSLQAEASDDVREMLEFIEQAERPLLR